MECFDGELAFAFFDVKEADGTESDAAAGIECLHQFVIALRRLQLIVHHPKHVGGDAFEFELGVIRNATFAVELLVAFASQIQSQHSATLWENLLCRADDFGYDCKAA